MNASIGILIRNGRTIYYAYIQGVYCERYSLEDMEHCIHVRTMDTVKPR